MLIIRMFSYNCLRNLILLTFWEALGSEGLPRCGSTLLGNERWCGGLLISSMYRHAPTLHRRRAAGEEYWFGLLSLGLAGLELLRFAVPFVSLSSSLRPEKMCLILRVTCKDSEYELSRGQACLSFSFLFSEFLALSLAWKDLVNIDGRKDGLDDGPVEVTLATLSFLLKLNRGKEKINLGLKNKMWKKWDESFGKLNILHFLVLPCS